MKSLIAAFGVFITSLCLLSCRSSDPHIGSAKAQESADLSWDEAKERKERVSNVDYKLWVSVGAGEAVFRGRMDMSFDLTRGGRDLRVDFFGGHIQVLSVNGHVLGADAKHSYWLILPGDLLVKGHNQVHVEYVQEYSHQAQGLNAFVDPETHQTFLFSQFESFDANRFMPCFDQPDLRATMNLTVEAPSAWQVISTTLESGVIPAGVGRKTWTFAKTAALPTYLFSLHAGPFRVWKDQYGSIPLRLFARPSMARYVHADQWFKLTKQGLKYFETFFASPYPFGKYDQLFVPEFEGQAMENVAAVTFGEDLWSRGEFTRAEQLEAANDLLHEMAHHWFGNLVTMKWWNDLWLNESFASFMASQAMVEATEFKDAWIFFAAGEEAIAYREDAMVTTHPIQAEIHTVKDSLSNFDGVTYGKGAAVLKLLRHYVGSEAFQHALQKYTAANAFKNADLKEFISRLQAESPKRDLNRWAERWLRQSGTDGLQARWQCDGAELKELRLITTPSAGASFRPQAVRVGLFYEHNGRLQSGPSQDVDLNSSEERVKGPWPCPDFIYPNMDNEAYAQVSLDERSLVYITRSLGHIGDDLLRLQVWQNLWTMVGTTQLPLKTYLQIAEGALTSEKNIFVLHWIVGTLSSPGHDERTAVYYWPRQHEDEKYAFIDRLEHLYFRRFSAPRLSGEEKQLWLEAYIGLAQSPPALNQIAQWAHQPVTDMDQRWMIARQLTRFAHPAAAALTKELQRKDGSDRGARALLAIEAIKPLPAVKRKWVDILKKDKSDLSLSQVEGVLGSLFPSEQKELARPFTREYYDYLKRNGTSENETYVELMARRLAPLDCEAEAAAAMREFLEGPQAFSPTVKRALRSALQDDETCQRVRAASRL